MECRKWENRSGLTEFLLLSISNGQDYHLLFIGLLMMTYLFCLVGNIFIIAAANLVTQLRSPMYFFLSNLSFVDLCLTSVTVPKCLTCLLTMNFHITFHGCLTQMYMFIWLVATELSLLTVMSYDRYVAVCKPLHYTLVISKKLCFRLVVASWLLGCLHALLHVSITFHLGFCGSNVIHSFFCDLPAVLDMSSSDTYINHLLILTEGSFTVGFLFNFTLGTYICIITSILRLRSAQTRKKAFMTCSSHLTVIVLFYVAALSVYFTPPSSSSQGENIVASLMYTIVSPTLNPFIYSLRNNEMKAALKKTLMRTHVHGI